MKIQLTIVIVLLSFSLLAQREGNDLYKTANLFLNALDENRKAKAQYPFESTERYRWHYVPLNDR